MRVLVRRFLTADFVTVINFAQFHNLKLPPTNARSACALPSDSTLLPQFIYQLTVDWVSVCIWRWLGGYRTWRSSKG